MVLADAFGNVIDEVEYRDDAPWPTAADGDGPFLCLIDPNLDNALASSWVSSSTIVEVQTPNVEAATVVYPNPTTAYLYVQNAAFQVRSCQVYDLQGRLLLEQDATTAQPLRINVADLAPNAYLLRVNFADGGSVYRGFVRGE